MERSKCILIGILSYCFLTGFAQNDKIVYHAFISNNMGRWKQLIDELQIKKHNESGLHELINFQYGYIAWCIGNKKKKEAEKYLDLAEKNLEKSEKTKLSKSIINSYKSAFYGFRIGLNIAKAPFLGPKSIEKAREAMKDDPTNPYGHIQYANAKYYMPSTFGGSKYIALEHYLKAEKIFESYGQKLKHDWNYINLLAIIAQAYTATDRLHLAQNYYEKILKIEPNFLWVKEKLYPELLKLIKETHE
jgi:tetratricopeptide (TPR) repeat protein